MADEARKIDLRSDYGGVTITIPMFGPGERFSRWEACTIRFTSGETTYVAEESFEYSDIFDFAIWLKSSSVADQPNNWVNLEETFFAERSDSRNGSVEARFKLRPRHPFFTCILVKLETSSEILRLKSEEIISMLKN